MELKSKYDDFYALIQADDRSATLDPGNVKMTFNNVSSLNMLRKFGGCTWV